jgi:hypothetical protein
MPKQRLQRCNARRRRTDAALYRAERQGRLMKYLRSSSWCRNWPVRGKKRCRLHGGRSTGPTTPEGMARTIAAMKAGRLRWLAQLKSEGKQIPCGRKKGGSQRTVERARARRLLARMRAQISGRGSPWPGLSGRRVAHNGARSARTPVAGWRSTSGGRLARMLAGRIGPGKNGRSSEAAIGRYSDRLSARATSLI